MTTMQSDDCQTNDPNNLFPMSIESLRFPLDSTMRIIFTGYYNGFNVEVRSVEEMAMLHHMGCFGKGSLSRSKPKISQRETSPQLMRKRQFQKRNDWYKKFSQSTDQSDSGNFFRDIDDMTIQMISDGKKHKKTEVIDLVSSDERSNQSSESSHSPRQPLILNNSENQDLVVIVPNSDSEGDNYFTQLKPECCINKTKLREKLMLTLQESFFLSYGLGCLQILNSDDKILSTEQCWKLFLETDKNFVCKYVVYHYFRSKGYIVKPGIKYGGDYLIYKEGPGITHADYIVVIKQRNQQSNWVSILGHIRLATTTAKEIIIAELSKKNEESENTAENLNNFNVREILLTRKLPILINDED